MAKTTKDLEDKIDNLINAIASLAGEIKDTRDKETKEKKKTEEEEKKRKEAEKKYKKLKEEREEEGKKVQESIGRLKNTFHAISSLFKTAFNDFTNTWAKVDQTAFDLSKSVGLSSEHARALRSSTIGIVNDLNIALKYNTSSVELLKMQTKLTEESGRNLLLGAEQMEKMAAMKQMLGEDTAMRYTINFERMGFDVDAASKKNAQIWNSAKKSGISAAKYSKNLLDNFDMVQRYTFKNGIEGLQEMARQSTAIRWDMQQTASFAEKVSTIEGAVKTGASLSVLGGGFANVGNPMQLLYGALNDVESLNERVTKMFSNMATYNEKTKQIEVSAFNRMRIKSATQAMGIDFGKTMDSVYAQGRRKKAESELSSVASKDKDLKDMILNMSQIDRETGKSYVTIVGDGKQYKKDVSELSPEDLENLRKMGKSEGDDIRIISSATQGANEKLEGIKKNADELKNKFFDKWGDNFKGFMTSYGGMISGLIAIKGALSTITTLMLANMAGSKAGQYLNILKNGRGGTLARVSKNSVGKLLGKYGSTAIGTTASVAGGVGGAIGGGLLGYGLGELATSDWKKNSEERMRDGKGNGYGIIGANATHGAITAGLAAGGALMATGVGFLPGLAIAGGSALLGALIGGGVGLRDHNKIKEEMGSDYKFATGGIVNGPSHAHGGVNIEAEGGEFIVNKASTSKHIDELKAINNDTIKSDTIIKPISPMGEQLKVNSSMNNNEYIGTNKINFSPMDIGMNGTLKLDLGGYTKDIDSRELMQNQDFIRSVRDIIAMEMNKIEFRRFNKKEYYRKM